MGLFSKKNGYEAAAMELEEQQRRRERSQAASSAQAQAPQPKQTAPAPKPALRESVSESAKPAPNQTLTYGIDEVIQLMRDLPEGKKEMVIHIVQKTLLSAKIDIKTILDKAARKIESLQSRNDKLRGEIRDLEELIIQKKSDVERLRRDMEETQQVRQSFEAVFLRGGRPATTNAREEETFAAARPAEALETASS